MAQLPENFRPYAAASNVLAVIQRARSRNLPESINNDFLRIAGVPEIVFGRVMQVLRFLNLVHEDGRPTETFQALAAATDTDYRQLLENTVRDAYRIEFSMVDPGQDPQAKIINAFQPYQPRSQIHRMVMLFLGLCREAGIPVLDAPRQRRMKESTVRRSRVTTGERSSGLRESSTTKIPERIVVPQSPQDVLFSLTVDDASLLDKENLKRVWDAIFEVQWAKALSRKQARESAEETSAETQTEIQNMEEEE